MVGPEIVPPGREGDIPGFTALRYQQASPLKMGAEGELATVTVRHKQPGAATSTAQAHHVATSVQTADADTAFASAVAEAAMVLRGDPLASAASLPAAVARARQPLGEDPGGWRAEFVRLMGLSSSLRDLRRETSSEP